MEFFAIIGILAIAIFFWQRLKAWRDDHLGPSEPEETEDINEPPELTDSIARLYNRQSRFFHPDFQFDLSTPMSNRFQNANKLPYIKTFDAAIETAKDTLIYLRDIVFVKITYSDLTIPVRWLMERDEAELNLKYTLRKAVKAYELHNTEPQTAEIGKLCRESVKYAKELQRIKAAIRDLLAVKSPQDRPLSPKAPD